MICIIHISNGKDKGNLLKIIFSVGYVLDCIQIGRISIITILCIGGIVQTSRFVFKDHGINYISKKLIK